MAHTYVLERTQLIRLPRQEVFPFFASIDNLEAITPASVGFQILSPRPLPLGVGTLIDYRIKLFGLPLHWRTRIETFEPPLRFSDVQLRGPFRLWHHVHEFTEVPDGTLMTDRIEYQIPLGPLGALAHGLFVRRMLRQIFDYRAASIERLLGNSNGFDLQSATVSA